MKTLMTAGFLAMAFVLVSCGGEAKDPGFDVEVGASDELAGNTAKLTWKAPTTNTDGSALKDLAGFKVYTKSPQGVTTSKDVGNKTSFAWGNLPRGTSTFWVTAYNAAKAESKPSASKSKAF